LYNENYKREFSKLCILRAANKFPLGKGYKKCKDFLPWNLIFALLPPFIYKDDGF